MAQLETKQPPENSFIHTRTCSPPRVTTATMQRDPCNYLQDANKIETDNLWPRLQEKAAQVSHIGTHHASKGTAHGVSLHNKVC